MIWVITEAFRNFLDNFNCCEGDDGRDFVSVEHCGDDFLAALAETMQGSEDWDDLQAMESEACGALNDMLDERVLDNGAAGNDDDSSRNYIDIVDDSPQPSREGPTLMELDSSSDGEDLDFRVPKQKDQNRRSCTGRSSGEKFSRSLVRIFQYNNTIKLYALK